MADPKQDTVELTANLEEIKHLEEKLAKLKRHLLDASSTVLSDIVSDGEYTSFLIVTVLNRRFALPVDGVEEVIEVVAPVMLNNPHPGVVGLINYHGTFIVLFDFAKVAGIGENSISEDHVVVVCIFEEKRFAVLVNEAMDVVTVANQDIRIADEVMSGVMREIAVIETETGTAAVVDLWSSVMALPLRVMEDVEHITAEEAAYLMDEEGDAS